MSFASSSFRFSNKPVQEVDHLDVCIDKPLTLAEVCPVETTTQRLPLIEERPRRKKEIIQKTKKASESSEYWLKPGVSLPKLKSTEAPQSDRFRRHDGSELFHPATSLKASDSGAGKSSECSKDLQEVETDKSATVCSDAVGPSASQFLFRVPSSELNFDEFKVEEEELEESHALQRWKHWLKEHRHLQDYLSKRLHRKKCDLQFQNAQNYRVRQEDKSLLFLAQMPAADKWRGHPFFWRSPYKIGGRENLLRNDDSVPKYYGVKTKLEKGEIPDMEFIGIPATIMREKGLFCSCEPFHDSGNPNWDRLPYRRDVLSSYRKETHNLKPHNVQMDELAVVGTKMPQKQSVEVTAPAELENLPQIKVTGPENGDSCSINYYNERSSVFSICIDGIELEYEIGNENCQKITKNVDLTWQIDFGVNIVGTIVERTLRVENKGTMAVEYNFLFWKPDDKLTLSSLQLKQHEPCFYFDKNPGIFLPGQIYELKFYNYSKRSGVRKETWRLKTEPPLTMNGETAKIVLWAASTDDSSDSIIDSLDSYLRKRVTRSTVDFILKILMRKALNPLEDLRGIEYRSLFFEKDLFEYQNPKHYYHSVTVAELHKIFEQIPCKKQPEWDLSLASLIELTRSYVKVKDQDSLLRQISQKATKLLRPNRLSVKNIKKYRMTYEILCQMGNFLDEDYDYLRNCFVQRSEHAKGTGSEFGETLDEELSGSSIKFEEREMLGESWLSSTSEVLRPPDSLFFRTMFYLKVYYRVSEAVDQVAGALETSKLTEPWKVIDPKLTKPSGGGRE